MDIFDTILKELKTILDEGSPVPLPDDVSRDTRLEDLALDSLSYSNLLNALESTLGYIPTKVLQGVWFPDTLGDLVEAYEEEAPSSESGG